MLRKRFGWLASLATAISTMLLGGRVALGQSPDSPSTTVEAPPLAAVIARGQDPTNTTYEVPPPEVIIPSPLGHPRFENGGLYVAVGFKYFMQTNPTRDQIIAVHGLIDRDGSIGAGRLGLSRIRTPGQFIGDGSPALSTGQVSGPLSFQPGIDMTIGWRFQNGIAVEFNWFRIFEAHYSASATSALSPNQNPGASQENTFITAPVYNYSPFFDGPTVRLATNPGPTPVGNPGATAGIWNAASIMTETFTQRFDQWQINMRYPLQQTDCYRLYGLFGGRAVAIWERYSWLTVAQDANGIAGAIDQANYSNVVSNRLYGLHLGLGNEWLISTTPIGAFAISTDLEAALFANFVNAQAEYVLGDNSTGASHKRGFFTLVPEVQANINFWWYPYEGIQVRAGWDIMTFFNTVSSPNPVDFNVGAVDPGWQSGTIRTFHGLNFSIAFIF